MLVAACVTVVSAQKTTSIGSGTAGSPHVRTEWAIDGAAITIEYGRPALRGRLLKSFEWYGQEWRTGADEATLFKTDRRLRFGTLVVPPGTYALHTLTGDRPWQLIFNKTIKRAGSDAPAWGIPYPGESSDLGRVPMRMGTVTPPVDLLTISIDDTPAGGTLRIEWGTLRASVPFTVG
jgi:hypothetical protein